MNVTRHVALVPRDGFFCKDARGWHTSASGRGHSLNWPWPSTVLGAIRTAWGRWQEAQTGRPIHPDDWVERTREVRLGKTVVLRREPGRAWAIRHRLWPAPVDGLVLKGHQELYRLDPVPPTVRTLGRDDDEAREALWRPEVEESAKPETAPPWWTEERFAAWLAGANVQAVDPGHTLEVSRRLQVHVGIRADLGTADEGILFSDEVIETLERDAEWAIGAEVSLPEGDLPGLARLGSDGRLVYLEGLTDLLFDPPEILLNAFRGGSRGLRLVIVTPACFTEGWLPDGLSRQAATYRGSLPGIAGEVILRAAFVPRPLHVSGWDMARNRPKRTDRMVAPGAVYFFERADGQLFTEEDARSLWLAALGGRTDEGFGRVAPGVWNPKRED